MKIEATAPYGWVFYGPDGCWHWRSTPDHHESVEDQRPATSLEKTIFNMFGNTTAHLPQTSRS
jgi:hypothetical protein